jgi:chorismate synthase
MINEQERDTVRQYSGVYKPCTIGSPSRSTKTVVGNTCTSAVIWVVQRPGHSEPLR